MKLTAASGAALSLSLCLTSPVNAAYKLVDDYTSSNFWSGFNFFDGPDPTNGNVQYVDVMTANAKSLAGSLPHVGNAIYMGVDHLTQTQNRASVRVSSNKAYTKGLFVVDIQHVSAQLPAINSRSLTFTS